MKPSVSIIVPAYNEAEGLRGTYETLMRVFSTLSITEYELLIMSCGSVDGTLLVGDELARENPRVRHIPNTVSPFLGHKYREGVRAARHNYVSMVPAHNLTTEESLIGIFEKLGKAEAVFTYTSNTETRPIHARFVSRGFVILWNTFFGFKMRYYNGISIIRRQLVLRVPMTAEKNEYMAEIMTYLLASGAPYIETIQELKPSSRTGRVWNLSSVWQAICTLATVFWAVRIKKVRVDIS